MKKAYLLFYLLIFIHIALINLHIINASENNIDFGLSAVIPENQIDKTKSYFDLMMKPSDVQELVIKIFNSSKQKETFEITLAYATTNSNGLIDYTIDDISKKDESLNIPFTKIASNYPREIQIDANSVYDLKITITMPKEEFDGVILGGINVKKKLKSDHNTDKNVTIKNQYGYVIGILLRENNKNIPPNLHLKSVKPDLVNYKRAIVSNIQNSEATLIKDLKLVGKIFSNNSDSPIKEFSKEGLSTAPNSNFNFIMDWGNENLKPGKYTLKLTADAGDKHWEWNEEFAIEKEKSEEINNNAMTVPEKINTSINSALVGLVLVLSSIIAFLIILLIKSKKNKN